MSKEKAIEDIGKKLSEFDVIEMTGSNLIDTDLVWRKLIPEARELYRTKANKILSLPSLREYFEEVKG